jgi:hypothetical protein
VIRKIIIQTTKMNNMPKYFKPERKFKENELLTSTVNSARRKRGDLIKIAYVARVYSADDFLVGYDFHKNEFSECSHKRLMEETRPATPDEVILYKKGKRNINE